MKNCRKCGVEKDEREFSARDNVCKACRSQQGRDRYYANREKRLQQEHDRYLANPEKKRQREHDRYHANSEKKRQQGRDRYHANPEKVRDRRKTPNGRAIRLRIDARRRALKRNALPPDRITDPRVDATYWIASYLRSLGFDVHVDHIIPLARGGLHVYENLQILPGLENESKCARHPTADDLETIAFLQDSMVEEAA